MAPCLFMKFLSEAICCSKLKTLYIYNLLSHWALSNCCDPLWDIFHIPMIKIAYTPPPHTMLPHWKIALYPSTHRIKTPCHDIVAEPPELSRLKCAGHYPKGNTGSNALQMKQFFRVTSRYNHRFSDRTSIPRTKASPEILQPYILQHRWDTLGVSTLKYRSLYPI